MATQLTFQLFPVNVYFNHPPYPIDAVNFIDPKNFAPYDVQSTFYAINPRILSSRVQWARNQLLRTGNIFKYHCLQLCPNVKNGFTTCHPNCGYIHHIPALDALKSIERELKYIASLPLPPKPLIIDEYVHQPIEELNRETDQEEAAEAAAEGLVNELCFNASQIASKAGSSGSL